MQKAVLVSGVQVPPPQTLGVPPPPQVWGEVQVRQATPAREAPQLSVPLSEPQFFPRRMQKAVLVSGGQVPRSQTLGVPPPPQVCGEVQVPQATPVREA